MRATGVALVIGLAVAGCSSDDESSPAATSTTRPVKAAVDLTVGDCFDGLVLGRSERAEVESVSPVECRDPHDLEVIHAFEFGAADGIYPGQDEVVAIAEEGCAIEFGERIGELATLGLVTLWPTVESWVDGDRRVVCAVYQEAGGQLVGTTG